MNWVGLQMLRNDRAKFAAMIVAVSMAVFLMQNQAAILATMLSMTAAQIRDVQDADLWVTEPDVECFDQVKAMRDIHLLRVRGVPGIAWAAPLLKIDAIGRSERGRLNTVTVLGIDDASLAGLPHRMRVGRADAIRELDTALIDPGGHQLFFPGEPFRPGRFLRIRDRRIRIVGISDIAAPFTGLPMLHTSRSTAVALNLGERHMTSFILARSAPGGSPDAVCRSLNALGGLRARTTEQFATDAMWFYGSQGVPMLFMVTITIGLIVGAAITGQTFLMFIKENARPISMLKVVGTTDRQLGVMILLQGTVVLTLGSCFGSGIAAAVCNVIRTQPFLRSLYLPWEIALGTCLALASVTGIALYASFRHVRGLEPASVFR
jgi:putative ABC transport system permease protein